MSTLRPFSALLGLAVAVPLLAQAPTQRSATFSVGSDAAKPAAAPAASATTDTAVTWIDLRSNQGELRGKLPQLVQAEIAKARAQGRTPFLEVGATWCGPCVALEQSLHNKDIIDAFAGTYIVHLDANEWDIEDDMGPLGFKGGTIPAILAIDKNGKVQSELHGETDAAPIKKFLQAHMWKGKPATSKVAVKS